jgi:hypothetical protein
MLRDDVLCARFAYAIHQLETRGFEFRRRDKAAIVADPGLGAPPCHDQNFMTITRSPSTIVLRYE